MKSIRIALTASLLALAAGTPALAQDAMAKDSMHKDAMMSSGSHMKMTMSQKKMMTKCQSMDHDMMMKNKGCMKMMKMHPDMMQGH